MEYVTIERSVYEAMVATLDECRSILGKAIIRLAGNERQEWIDNHSAQLILQRSQRGMTSLRTEGKIGYTIIEGKVYYPAEEICRLLYHCKIDHD